MNIKGCGQGDHIIWVLEDPKLGRWSYILIRTPLSVLHQLKSFPSLSFEGFTRCGNLVFSQAEGSVLALYIFNQNTKEVYKKKRIKRGASTNSFTFWNHVESVMLCNKVCLTNDYYKIIFFHLQLLQFSGKQ